MGTTPMAFKCMNTGCSSRHAVHHEAKTLTSDTSPLRSALARPSVRPLTGGSLNSGTTLPISAEGIVPGSRVVPQASKIARPKNTARGPRNTIRRIPERALPAARLFVATIRTLISLPIATNGCHRKRRNSSTVPSMTTDITRRHAALTATMENSQYKSESLISTIVAPSVLLGRKNLSRRGIASDFVDRKRCRLMAGHSRRTRGHARNRNADDGRMFGQKLLDDVCGNMAFDCIIPDHRHMAAVELFRDVQLFPDKCEVLLRVDDDFETCAAQILGIIQATGAVRISVKRDFCLFLRYRRRRN